MKYRMQLIRFRKSTTLPTLGNVAVFEDDNEVEYVETLELPWKDNARNISCIPEGVYWCRKRHTNKRGWHFHVTGVPNRTWILFHVVNFVRDLRGCVGPGIKHIDIDGDGVTDISSSRVALERLLKAVKTNDKFKIEIL